MKKLSDSNLNRLVDLVTGVDGPPKVHHTSPLQRVANDGRIALLD